MGEPAGQEVVGGPEMQRFSRALSAFLGVVLPPIEDVVGGRGGSSPDRLALAEAHAIVSAFVPVDGSLSHEEVAALLRAGAEPAGRVPTTAAERAELARTLEHGRVMAGARSVALACCAVRDAADGGVRGRRYVRAASELAAATCALDGTVNEERAEVRAFEQRLFDELQEDLRQAEHGVLSIELPATGLGPAPVPQTSRPVDTESVEEALAALDRLIGLRSVKEKVTTLTNLLRVQQRRRALGLPVPTHSHHLVFVGPPGTGKTTVARLLGRILRALGILDHGEVREVAREDLVGGYLGETALKADRVVDEALGGILFVDEAYTLAPENPMDSFGAEAIATLVKRMEDDRDRFVLIVAGYEREMARFLASNPGLASRFSETISFPHYDPDELERILGLFLRDSGYELAPEARRRVSEELRLRWDQRSRDFGNARMVRNLFEDMLAAHANRVAAIEDADAAMLSRIEPGDVESAIAPR